MFALLFRKCSVQLLIFLIICCSIMNYFLKTPPLQNSKTPLYLSVEQEEEDDEYIKNVFILNFAEFRRDYEEMVKKLKIFIYPDGDENLYYQTPRTLSGVYASEGYFFKNIKESSLITDNPNLAHMYFIPISCHKLSGKVVSNEEKTEIVQDYVLDLARKYEYWNRTKGADHFIVSCHGSCTEATKGTLVHLMRLMCASTSDNGFDKEKDVSIPQVFQPFDCPPGGYPNTNRSILGYWAGHANSEMRKRLVELWNNDSELDIQKNRYDKDRGLEKCRHKFTRSKFCICPQGSLANSICITRAIYYGCIPVILSKNFVLPFEGVLNWTRFSVVLQEGEVDNLKTILKAKAERDYTELKTNLMKVKRHFRWNNPAVPYDAFHMVIYDLWMLWSSRDY